MPLRLLSNTLQLAVRRNRMKHLRQHLDSFGPLQQKAAVAMALDIFEQNGVDTFTVKDRFGNNICLSTSDKVISARVVQDGAYQLELMQHFCTRLTAMAHDPAVLHFVNIGANIGTTAINAKSEGFSRFTLFEPNARNFSILAQNAAALGDHVTLHQKGVGDKNGPMTLHLSAANHGAHSLKRSGGKTESIDIVTLDSIGIDNLPLVLWIDAEGYEPQIMTGATNVLRTQCVAMVMEITPALYDAIEREGLTEAIFGSFTKVQILQTDEAIDRSAFHANINRQTAGTFDIMCFK